MRKSNRNEDRKGERKKKKLLKQAGWTLHRHHGVESWVPPNGFGVFTLRKAWMTHKNG